MNVALRTYRLLPALLALALLGAGLAPLAEHVCAHRAMMQAHEAPSHNAHAAHGPAHDAHGPTRTEACPCGHATAAASAHAHHARSSAPEAPTPCHDSDATAPHSAPAAMAEMDGTCCLLSTSEAPAPTPLLPPAPDLPVMLLAALVVHPLAVPLAPPAPSRVTVAAAPASPRRLHLLHATFLI